jgi:hypothetical protein
MITAARAGMARTALRLKAARARGIALDGDVGFLNII